MEIGKQINRYGYLVPVELLTLAVYDKETGEKICDLDPDIFAFCIDMLTQEEA